MKKIWILLVLLLYCALGYAQSDVTDDESEPEVWCDYPETSPIYPGGEEVLMNFIHSNLRIPKKVKDGLLKGVVVAKMRINKKGRVKDLEIAKSLDHECDKEVLRVLSHMKRWKPGTREGKIVESHYYIPVRFGF